MLELQVRYLSKKKKKKKCNYTLIKFRISSYQFQNQVKMTNKVLSINIFKNLSYFLVIECHKLYKIAFKNFKMVETGIEPFSVLAKMGHAQLKLFKIEKSTRIQLVKKSYYFRVRVVVFAGMQALKEHSVLFLFILFLL